MASSGARRTLPWRKLVAASPLILVLLTLSLPAAQAEARPAQKVTVTFNAAGGKIGSKATVKKKVVKGKKVGKLPGAKRVAYAFKGWYTKRTGGKKVAVSTKVRARSTFYARWRRVLSAKEKGLVGDWGVSPTVPLDKSARWIKFHSDGTFSRNDAIPSSYAEDYQNFWLNEGLWRVQEDQIIATNLRESVEWHANNRGRGYTNKPIPDQKWTYYFDNKDMNGQWEGHTWLIINHYPHRGGFDEYGHDYVKPTQVGCPAWGCD